MARPPRRRLPLPHTLLLLSLLISAIPHAACFSFPDLRFGAVSEIKAASAGRWVAFSGGLRTPNVASDVIYVYETDTRNTVFYGMSTHRHGHAFAAALGSSGAVTMIAWGGNETLGAAASSTYDQLVISAGIPSNSSQASKPLLYNVTNAGGAGVDKDSTSLYTAAGSGYLVFAGGRDPASNLLIPNVVLYDIDTDAWNYSLPPLAEARELAVVGAWANAFVVSGGYNASGVPSAQIDIYHFNTSWTLYSQRSMPIPRARHVITARPPINGVILFSLVGGVSDSTLAPITPVYWGNLTVVSNFIVVYTPIEDNVVLRLPVPLSRLGGACGRKTCAYIGGLTSGGTASQDVTVFDEAANRDGYTLPSGVSDVACAASPLTDVIVCAGGQDSSNTYVANVTAFGLVDFFDPPFQLREPKRNLGIAADGDLIVIAGGCLPGSGGLYAQCNGSASVDVISLGNFSIGTFPDLAQKRGFVAAAAANGIFMFAGGTNNDLIYGTIDVYLFDGSHITNLSLSSARWGVAAAATGNYIIFAGGFDDVIYKVTTANAAVDVFRCDGSVPVALVAAVLPNAVGLAVAIPNVGGSNLVNVIGGAGLNGVPNLQNAQYSINTTDSTVTRATGIALASSSARSWQAGFGVAGRGIIAGGAPVIQFLDNATIGTTLLDTFMPTGLYVSNGRLDPPTVFAAGAGMPLGTTGMLTGGYDSSNGGIVRDLIQMYEMGHWSRLRLQLPRYAHGAAATQTVFAVAGGLADPNTYISTVELYTTFYLPRPLQPTTPPPTTPAPPAASTLPPGTTQPQCLGTPPAPEAVCTNGVWVIPENTTSITGNVTVIGNQTIIINGTLILVPGAITIIQINPNNPTAPIQVTGAIVIDGTLQIVLTTSVANGTLIPLVSGSGDINGTFTGVNVTTPDRCEVANGYIRQETSTGIAVLITVADTCSKKKGGLSRGAIAGIVVGAILFLAVAVLIGIIILKRKLPGHKLFNPVEKTGADGWR